MDPDLSKCDPDLSGDPDLSNDPDLSKDPQPGEVPPPAFLFQFSGEDFDQVLVRGPGVEGTVYTHDSASGWISPLGEWFPQCPALDMMRQACQAVRQ